MTDKHDARDVCDCGHYREEHEPDGDVVICYGRDDEGNPTCMCDEFECVQPASISPTLER